MDYYDSEVDNCYADTKYMLSIELRKIFGRNVTWGSDLYIDDEKCNNKYIIFVYVEYDVDDCKFVPYFEWKSKNRNNKPYEYDYTSATYDSMSDFIEDLWKFIHE